MSDNEPETIFISSDVSASGLAGAFEQDDETAYFYLYDTTEVRGPRILGSISIGSANEMPDEADIAIRWDKAEEHVGLFIVGQLWAAFHVSGQAYGGDYRTDGIPPVFKYLASKFSVSRWTNS